jgi:PadR family transcriptional regulator PadR
MLTMTKQQNDLTLPDENWKAQLRKGWLELSILAVLWDERLYGLEILRRLELVSSLVVTEGTVYPVLARLRKEALVKAEWVEPESGHPRRYYKLTSKGRKRTVAMAYHAAEFTQKIDRLISPLLEQGDIS